MSSITTNALSGLRAATDQLSSISNNLANANTVSYKTSNFHFAAVYAGLQGSGVNPGTSVKKFTLGNLSATSSPLDLAINGAGMFALKNGAYTRDGRFDIDKDNYVVNIASGQRLQGYLPAAPNTLTDIQLSNAGSPANPSTTLTMGVNLKSSDSVPSVVFNTADPTTANSTNYSSTTSIYDSLGNVHNLDMYFIKTAANTWSVEFYVDGVQPAAGPTNAVLTFDTDGSFISTAPSPLTLTPDVSATGASSPMSVTIDFGNSTQFNSAYSVSEARTNGYPPGSLNGITVSSDGVLSATYSNGTVQPIATIPVFRFPNYNGLQDAGGNSYFPTSDSGTALTTVAGEDGSGQIVSGALEESTTDVGEELVEMTKAVQFYQANGKMVMKASELISFLIQGS